ncbi:hypothetical protein FXO37_17660 [Capsicum annuum]|nr:hypothetical protein FXO37_17660 [Capsicum annuum]
MAKTTVDSGGGLPAAAKAADEMKRELQRAVNSIIEDDNYSLEANDRAMQCLCALKDLKLKPNFDISTFSLSLPVPPHEFVCPLSNQLMKDPVVLASGQVVLGCSGDCLPQISRLCNYIVVYAKRSATPATDLVNLLLNGMVFL